jgi:hypothetical protein
VDAPLSAYLALLDRLDLAHGVLVQPSFLGTDNSYLLDRIRATGSRLRGVAVVAVDITAAGLAELGANGIAGIQLNLVGAPVPDFRSVAWRAHLRRIAEAGLHVEVQCHGPDVPQVIPPLLETLPTVVLDHFGLPPGWRGSARYPVRRQRRAKSIACARPAPSSARAASAQCRLDSSQANSRNAPARIVGRNMLGGIPRLPTLQSTFKAMISTKVMQRTHSAIPPLAIQPCITQPAHDASRRVQTAPRINESSSSEAPSFAQPARRFHCA